MQISFFAAEGSTRQVDIKLVGIVALYQKFGMECPCVAGAPAVTTSRWSLLSRVLEVPVRGARAWAGAPAIAVS